jgi:cob(I)alamin adenosyltransferase
MKLEHGRVQVYTGDGKGKTTAALGLALRASGHGMRSLIIQFMKGKTNYGELEAIKRIPEISILQFGTEDFVMKGKEQEIDYREARAALKRAGEAMKDPGLSILVLDEINVALFFQLIKPEDVIELVKSRPPGLELVLTGRRIPQEIKDLADLVTNFVEEKHYYSSQGLQARQGIEH